MSLPFDINPDTVRAEFKKGVLTVSRPKLPEVVEKTKKIEIKKSTNLSEQIDGRQTRISGREADNAVHLQRTSRPQPQGLMSRRFMCTTLKAETNHAFACSARDEKEI